MLLTCRADINAVRKDIIHEHVPEEELNAQMRSKCKSKDVMCDDPRDPNYVCPVRCIRVQETALHIALQKQQVGLAALLACAGADANLPRHRGETATSTQDLCGSEPPLLNALSATWPLPPSCHAFSDDELPDVEAAIAASAAI